MTNYWNLSEEQVKALADRLERIEADNAALRQRLERLVEAYQKTFDAIRKTLQEHENHACPLFGVAYDSLGKIRQAIDAAKEVK